MISQITPGFSKSGLARMRDVMSGYIERKEMPGLVSLISHKDDVQVDVLGTKALDSTAPMTRDTIFRIASITKPVTGVAAMILVEECKIRLDESVEPWLPELANRRVLRSISSEIDDTVSAARAITLRDLLTSTMGFGSVMARPGTYPIQTYIRQYKIGGDGPPRPAQAPSTDEWMRRLGSLPLMAQPGERWMYNVSVDVLGVLIERVAGNSFGQFMRERIFDPLGMRDTAFNVPAEKLDRFLPAYCMNYQTNTLEVYDGVEDSDWVPAPPFESGAGGLVSTINDYFAFCRMMLNEGSLNGEQILSPASVGLIASDQLTAKQRAGAELFFGDFSSWGFCVAVDTRRREVYHTPGRFGWTGGLGTTAYMDPAADMIGILFTQRMMDSPDPPRFMSDFWTLAYTAMD